MGDFEAKSLAILRLLREDKVWIDRSGTTHIISEMEPSHASNCVRMLLRNAVALATYYGMGQAVEIDRWEAAFGVPDDFDIPTPDEEWDQQVEEPVVWLMTRPLLLALSRRANQAEFAGMLERSEQ